MKLNQQLKKLLSSQIIAIFLRITAHIHAVSLVVWAEPVHSDINSRSYSLLKLKWRLNFHSQQIIIPLNMQFKASHALYELARNVDEITVDQDISISSFSLMNLSFINFTKLSLPGSLCMACMCFFHDWKISTVKYSASSLQLNLIQKWLLCILVLKQFNIISLLTLMKLRMRLSYNISTLEKIKYNMRNHT